MNNFYRIFHVVYSFDSIGGLENGLINIVNKIDNSSFHHVICSLTNVGDITNRIFNTNVTYYSIGKRSGNDPILPFKIYRLLKREAPDVVHLRNWPTMVEGFVAARMANIAKVIYSEHGRHFESVWHGKRLKTAIIRHILNSVDQCLCVSNDVASEMKSLYKLKRNIDVILNGVDTDKFRPIRNSMSTSKYGWASGINVGSVGRLDRGKKYHELISDFSSYSNGDTNLIIVGDGPELDNLTVLADKANSSSHIYLAGSRDNIPELLNCFDVFVLPSESEGLSNAIMEAMSCGLPVIAYDVGGNKELLQNGKGGFLIDKNDRYDFIAKVKYLIDNKEIRQKMGMFNRQYIIDNYSLTSMVNKYATFYSK